MGLPKRRLSRSRRGQRRAHTAVVPTHPGRCPSCGAYKQPHRVCLNCGVYKNAKQPVWPARS